MPRAEIPDKLDFETLLADHDAPVCDRYLALFQAFTVGNQLASLILNLLDPRTVSVLLRHEACYCLGQLQASLAANRLYEVACDDSENEIVRHEALEALSHIDADLLNSASERYISKHGLKKGDPISETIELAQISAKLAATSQGAAGETIDACVAAASENAADSTLESLAADLLNPVLELSKRYEAMYALRDKFGSQALSKLSDCLVTDRSSPLLKHELAFVAGQLGFDLGSARLEGDGRLLYRKCVDAFLDVVRNPEEHSMVRHEAAITLGSIGDPQTEVPALLKIAEDLKPGIINQDVAIVFESCLVAVRCLGYWHQKPECAGEQGTTCFESLVGSGVNGE